MSFARPERSERRNGPPMAPLVDVLFLLLIFFAVTSTFRQQERQQTIELPRTETGELAEANALPITINVEEDGTITINQTKYELTQLRETLRKLSALTPNEHVIVRGDVNAKHGDVQLVLDAARAAGFVQAGIGVTQRELSSE